MSLEEQTAWAQEWRVLYTTPGMRVGPEWVARYAALVAQTPEGAPLPRGEWLLGADAGTLRDLYNAYLDRRETMDPDWRETMTVEALDMRLALHDLTPRDIATGRHYALVRKVFELE